MAFWPFGKEQDEKRNVLREEAVKPQNATEIVVDEKQKPGSSSLDTLIAATETWSPAAPQKYFTQNQNSVPQPVKTVQPKVNSSSKNFEIQPAEKQNPQPKKVETTPQKNLTQDFGILSLEEQKRMDEEKAKPPAEKKSVKKRKTLGRTNEVKVRLTDVEKILLESRVKASGLKQGEFVRHAILHEKIETKSILAVDVRTMTELMKMGSEMGKIGGLIKKTVATNKEFTVLTPEEKNQLEKQMRELETLKREIQKVVQDIYGNY